MREVFQESHAANRRIMKNSIVISHGKGCVPSVATHLQDTRVKEEKKNVYDSAPVLITPDPTAEEAAGLLERSMSFAIFRMVFDVV